MKTNNKPSSRNASKPQTKSFTQAYNRNSPQLQSRPTHYTQRGLRQSIHAISDGDSDSADYEIDDNSDGEVNQSPQKKNFAKYYQSRPGVWKRRGGPRLCVDPSTVVNTSKKFVTVNLVKRIKPKQFSKRKKDQPTGIHRIVEETDTSDTGQSDILDEMDLNELLIPKKVNKSNLHQ